MTDAVAPRIAFGVDEAGELSDSVRGHLDRVGDVVQVVQNRPWPEVGREVGRAVAEGAAEFGVVMCWTGTGVSIAANKVSGVRAALCTDAATATGARRWNDANVLALGMRLTSTPVAIEIVDAFLAGVPDALEIATVRDLEGGEDASA